VKKTRKLRAGLSIKSYSLEISRSKSGLVDEKEMI